MLPFLEMPRFGTIPQINRVFLICKLISTAVVFTLTVINRRKLNNLDIGLIIYSLIIIFSTILNGGSVIDTISDALAIIVPVINVELYIGKIQTKKLILPMIILFTMYGTITAIQLPRVPFRIFATQGLRDSNLELYNDTYGSIFALGHPKRFVFMLLPLFIYTLIFCDDRREKKHRISKKIFLCYVFLITSFCLIYSWSVSAMLVILIVLLFYRFNKNKLLSKTHKIFNLNFLFACFVIINILLTATPFLELFTGFFALFGKSPTLSGRTYIWARAFRYIENKPIFGHGVNLELVASRFSNLVHLHNLFLNITYTGGILLLVCLIIILILLVKRLNININKNNKVKALAAGFICFLVLALTDTPDYNMIYMLFPFMYACNKIS